MTHPTPPEAIAALDAVRKLREAAGVFGTVVMLVDYAPGRPPKWRIIAGGQVVAAYDPRLVGRAV